MTKKRRYLIVAGILAGCVAIALGVLAMLPSQPGVTNANFGRIELGMTLAEVKVILGDDYQDLPSGPQFWSHPDETAIWVFFEKGQALQKFIREPSAPETIPDKLRRWLHIPK